MLKTLPLALIALLSTLIALATLRALPLGLVQAFPDMTDHAELRHLAFLAHIIAAPIALVLGAFQFMPKLRARFRGWHRWAGRAYGVAILISGAGGLVLALSPTAADISPLSGWVAGSGFGLLALVWVGVTARAVWLARQRRIAEHRAWMIRSFALTFAAVTLRLYLPIFMVAGYSYPQASVWLAWICWVPNLMLAEWLLRGRAGAQAITT